MTRMGPTGTSFIRVGPGASDRLGVAPGPTRMAKSELFKTSTNRIQTGGGPRPPAVRRRRARPALRQRADADAASAAEPAAGGGRS
jgi:hypothetical protein